MIEPTDVVRALREVAMYLRLKGDRSFKSRVYERAADSVAELGLELPRRIEAGTLQQTPGIGPSIERMITELYRTGSLPYRDRLASEFPPGILDLARLPMLPLRKVLTLWKKLGVGDLGALEQAASEGRVRELSGFTPALEAQLLEEIAAHRASGGHRVGIGDAFSVAEDLVERLRDRRGVDRAEVAGRVRRFSEIVDQVELIAAAREAKAAIEAFVSHPQVADVVSQGASDARVRLWEGELRARLTVVRPEAFVPEWNLLTGSGVHRRRLEALAPERGFVLSPGALLRGDTPVELREEPDLYAALGLAFVPPELREDGTEVDAALRGELPRLIEPGDVRGVVHNHTTWSDGRDSIEDMARAAQARGLEYMTLTDHSPTASYAGGLDVQRLLEQWREVDQVNAKLRGFRVLKGTESDILPDGSLDYPDELLARCDVVVGSIHARHRMNEDEMTERILGALDSPFLHVLGHLTGRLILRRDAYAIRTDEIFRKAAERGVAIEINGSPDRLDISSALVRRALELGVKLVVSTDAHSTGELDNLFFAVKTARKGWATREQVLNTRGEREFLAALEKPRH